MRDCSKVSQRNGKCFTATHKTKILINTNTFVINSNNVLQNSESVSQQHRKLHACKVAAPAARILINSNNDLDCTETPECGAGEIFLGHYRGVNPVELTIAKFRAPLQIKVC